MSCHRRCKIGFRRAQYKRSDLRDPAMLSAPLSLSLLLLTSSNVRRLLALRPCARYRPPAASITLLFKLKLVSAGDFRSSSHRYLTPTSVMWFWETSSDSSTLQQGASCQNQNDGNPDPEQRPRLGIQATPISKTAGSHLPLRDSAMALSPLSSIAFPPKFRKRILLFVCSTFATAVAPSSFRKFA